VKLNFIKLLLAAFVLQTAAEYAHGQNVKDLAVQAAQALRKKDYAQAIKLYSDAIQLDPQNDPAYTFRGDAFLLLDKRDEAIKDLSDAIRLNPTNYLAFELRGSVYYENQEFDKTIADLTVALTAKPQEEKHFKYLRGSAFKIRGICYSWQHSYTNAIADLSEALNFETNDYEIYERRGISFYGEKEFDKAVSDFNGAIRLNPQDTVSLFNRGRIYALTGLFTNAIQDFEAAIKQDPEAFQVYNRLAWLLATCPDNHIRNGKKAVELATKACELTEWGKSSYIDSLAAAYAETDDFKKAVLYEQQAINVKGISEVDQKAFQERMALYLQGKPYREPKNDNH